MDASTAPAATLYGFKRSTYVNVARLVLAAKKVTYAFHDTESEMYNEAFPGPSLQPADARRRGKLPLGDSAPAERPLIR